DRIEAANVVIEYRHVGLGIAGTPDSFGPEIQPTVTVWLRDMKFEFITPGLVGIVDISMPRFDATMTAEDNQTI
ncbi:MAG TPA: hypothetical protein VLS27_15040, partial [Gammaproteobacteria bacterium]|nr:hypothetical protein [Gammaproteobacteria bacterium]